MASNKKPREQEIKKGFWTSTRIGLSAAVLLLLVAIFALYPKSGAEDKTADAVAATSSPSAARLRSRGRLPLAAFPDGVMSSQIEMTKGNPIQLDQFGGKVVVVNLWATWCGPCRIEIPHLVEISNEFKSKGVEVLGLTTEEKEAAAAVDDFIKAFEIPYAVGWANPQIQRAVLGNSPSIPQSIIIGKDGKIFRHLIGFNPRLTPPQLRSAVEEALAQ